MGLFLSNSSELLSKKCTLSWRPLMLLPRQNLSHFSLLHTPCKDNVHYLDPNNVNVVITHFPSALPWIDFSHSCIFMTLSTAWLYFMQILIIHPWNNMVNINKIIHFRCKIWNNINNWNSCFIEALQISRPMPSAGYIYTRDLSRASSALNQRMVFLCQDWP